MKDFSMNKNDTICVSWFFLSNAQMCTIEMSMSFWKSNQVRVTLASRSLFTRAQTAVSFSMSALAPIFPLVSSVDANEECRRHKTFGYYLSYFSLWFWMQIISEMSTLRISWSRSNEVNFLCIVATCNLWVLSKNSSKNSNLSRADWRS